MARKRQGSRRNHPEGDEAAARVRRLQRAMEEKVLPGLEDLEVSRRRRLRYASMILGGALVLLAASLLLGLAAVPFGILLVVALIAVAGGFIVFSQLHRDAAADLLMPAACAAVGGIAPLPRAERPLLDALRRVPVYAGWSEGRVKSALEGQTRRRHFQAAHVELTRKVVETVRSSSGGSRKQTRTETIFDGLLLRIQCPAPFPARVILQGRRRHWLGQPRRAGAVRLAGLEKMEPPDPRLQRRFALWADDPALAGTLLTPALSSLLAEMAEGAGAGGLDAAFHGYEFLLALPRHRNRLRAGSLLRPAERLPEEAGRLMGEVAVIQRLAEVLVAGLEGEDLRAGLGQEAGAA